MQTDPSPSLSRSAGRAAHGALAWSAGLTFCILLAALVSSVALLTLAVRSVDENQAAYETRLVERNFDRSLQRVSRDLVSATTWDEAYVKTRGTVDQPWVAREWGAYFHNYFAHDLTIALDPKGAPFYAAAAGKSARTNDYAGFVEAAHPLVKTTQETAMAKRFDREGRRQVGLAATASATGIVAWKGDLYLTAVTNVTPETDQVTLSPEPDVLVISAKRVGPAFLNGVQDALALPDLQLGRGPASGRTQTFALKGLDGQPVGAVHWTPGDPGRALLWRFSVLIASGLLVSALASAALMIRTRSVVSDLVVKDAALDDALVDLTRARDAAQAANHAKSAFLANISHEIRTPLNGLIGMAQIMARHRLAASQSVRLKVIEDSAKTLLALLNDVLDMAKIEAGRLEITPAPTDIRALLESACQPFVELAAAKGLSFDVAVAPGLERPRLCDGLRTRQILANLASNALKFTETGGVRITAQPHADGVRFICEDTGIGMAADRLPELFSKFSQIDDSETRRAAGAGLGLALSRDLAERMQGSLSVESTLGLGSTFTLDLPAPLAPARALPLEPARPAPARGPKAALRILAAEDNAVNRMVLEALLKPCGARITLAEDGAEALAAYRACAFDLVLMDIQMPVMSGVEATRALRALEAEQGRPRAPILAVTANVLSHQVETYLAAGMDGVIAKPIKATALYEAIGAVLSGRTPETATAAWETQTAAFDAGMKASG